MDPGIANFDLSRVTSSLDDKMASAADASTGNGETKTQINVNWTNDEVVTIIDIWANVEIQGQLDGMRRNKKVYERISEEMAARGFVRTFKQCRNKIKWLKHEYKRVIDNNNRYVHCYNNIIILHRWCPEISHCIVVSYSARSPLRQRVPMPARVGSLSDMILDMVGRGIKEQPHWCMLLADDIPLCSTRRDYLMMIM